MTTTTMNTSAVDVSAKAEALLKDFAPLFGRGALASVFLLSGLTKIGQYAGTQAYMESVGLPGALLPLVIAFEIVAALMVTVGYRTRLAALALAGFSLVTAVVFHSNFADQIQTILFLKNVSIAGGLLLLAGHGPGRFAVQR